jgi:DNA polymerase I
MYQGSLMGSFAEDTGWRPPETFPLIKSAGMRRIVIDTETDGTDVHGLSRIVGIAIRTEDRKRYYLPIRHSGGGNLDEATTLRWARNEIRDCDVVMAEAKFDIAMLRKDNVDLEAAGCRPREIQFRAALLNEYRRSVKLNDLGKEYLGREKLDIDVSTIGQLPSYAVGPYAEMDVELTGDIFDVQQPQIEAQGLSRVADLEDDIIYAVLEMERNAARLDVPKLTQWREILRKEFSSIINEIFNQTGARINPDSSRDLMKLFNVIRIDYGKTATGLGSFTDEFLKGIKNPIVELIRRARAISSLLSKYLDKYYGLLRNGHLYYKLHQLKGDEFGTVAGRFSSSSTNIQQVFDAKRQKKKFGPLFKQLFGTDFLVRELFIPDEGMIWVRADASQIEFRLFAHYSGDQKIIDAYNNDPTIDYHQQVSELMDVDRQEGKDLNFGMLYVMGRDKLARSLGKSREETDQLYETYNEMFPGVRKLIYRAMNKAEERGWVKTILGRRARFYDEEVLMNDPVLGALALPKSRSYVAINRVIQGSAADILKLKLRDLYRERKNLGIHKLRFVVHDEFDFDVSSPERVKEIKQFLDRDAGLGIKVPLTWEIKHGPNWAAAA